MSYTRPLLRYRPLIGPSVLKQYKLQPSIPTHYKKHTTIQSQWVHTTVYHNQQYELFPMPPAPKLPISQLQASYRMKKGKYHAQWLRTKCDKIPALIQSCGPNSCLEPNIFITIDKYQWNAELRRGTIHSRIYNIQLPDGSNIPCTLNQTAVHPATDAVLNLNFQRHIESIPTRIDVIPDFDALDDCIGIKKGGEFVQLEWHIPMYYQGKAEHMPATVYVNMQSKQIGEQIVLDRDVPIPNGCTLVKKQKKLVLGKILGSDRYVDDDDDVTPVTTTPTPATPATPVVKKDGSNKASELEAAAAARAKKAGG